MSLLYTIILRRREASRIMILLVVVLFFGSVTALGQSAQEQALDELQRRLLVLQQENTALAVASDSLALEIQQQKGGEPLNFFARRRLESALRRAQDLASRREENLRRQTRLQTEIVGRAAVLDSSYALQIDSLLARSGRLQGGQRQLMAVQVQDLRSRRAALQEILAAGPVGQTAAGAIRISPGDLPEEITAKADLLRSREEQLRAQAQSLERRAGQVKQESALRKKMADLVSDVSLFEQRDETVQHAGRSPESGVGVTTEKGGVGVLDQPQNLMEAASPAEQLLRLDLRNLSAEDTDQLLHELEGQRRMLLLRADSLASRALQFDAEAGRLRIQLKQIR